MRGEGAETSSSWSVVEAALHKAQEKPDDGGRCTDQQRECPHKKRSDDEIRCHFPRTAEPRAVDMPHWRYRQISRAHSCVRRGRSVSITSGRSAFQSHSNIAGGMAANRKKNAQL